MIYEIIGLFGVITLLGAYTLLQLRKISGESAAYAALNLIGSLAILATLMNGWNLSVFLLEGAWALVSIYGIAKAAKR